MNFRCRIMFSFGRRDYWVLISTVSHLNFFFCIHSACQNEVSVLRRRDDSESPAKKRPLRQTSLSFFREMASISNFCCATNQRIHFYLSNCLRARSIASFTTLLTILLVGSPHIPRKFLLFSPPQTLEISIDLTWGTFLQVKN